MALEDLVSQFNASILVASEWANLALSPSTYQDLGLVAKCAAQANSNLSVAAQFKIDLELLLAESESNLSAATNKGETVSTLDYLKAELNSTRSAEQKANAELRVATTNVELALKLVEVLLANTGDVVELPKKLVSAIDAVCDAILTIRAASLEASDFPELAMQAAEEINREIEKLDEARSELDTARADLLEAMQKMGSPASPGLSALAGLQIAIGSLIEETQATLTAFQEDDQTIHSFSQLEKFAEAIQQIAAQAESAVEQDNILKASLHLRNQNSTMPEPIKTINGVSLSTVADQYFIINGNSPSIPITINGQPASKTNPGAGWQAIAVTTSKSGGQYELIWKKPKTGTAGTDQFASWKLDANGVFIKGDLLSQTGLLDLEDNLGSDINDDNAAGWNFQNGKQIQGLTLLTNDLAYAIKKSDGSIVKVTFNNGQLASKDNPGAGWQAIAAAPSKSDTQIELIWKNSKTGQFASWKLDANGVFIKGDLLSQTGLLDLEDNLGSDINDDNAAGWNFQNGKQIQGLTLLTNDLAYAIKKSDGSIVKVTFNNGQLASKDNPGAGWQAIAAAPSKSDTQIELIWKNSKTGQFASWKLDANGVFIKGDLLSQTGLLDLEDNLGSDINDDNAAGWNFQNGKQIQGLTLLTNDLAYAIKKSDGSIVKVTFNNGQLASKDNPGAGWQPVAVAPSKSNTQIELIWKNSNTGQFASWKLDNNGAFIKGDLLSQTGLLDLEDNLGSDLNDDKATGWNFQNGRQIQGLTLLTNDLAYAIKKSDGSIVKVTFNNGQLASRDNPGAGWQPVAVAPSKSNTQIELIWKNSNTGQFASWKLDNNGAFIKGDLLSQTGLLDLEDNLSSDLNDDNAAGWNFQNGRQIQGLTLLTNDLAYAIKKSDGSIVKVTFNNGQLASRDNPGAGWQPVAVAPSKSNTQIELIWKNSNTGQFASWKLDNNGAFIKGDLLSQTGLLDLEDNLSSDLNDDKATGWNFQNVRQIQGLTLLTNDLAYAIKKSDGSIVKVTFNNGQLASKDNPGAGWIATAVTAAENGNYYLYWENKTRFNPNRNLARWEVSSSGSYRDGKVLSESELDLDELNLQEDLNDDQRIGPFQKVEGTINPDNLTARPEQPFQVLYGRQGKDLLTSSSQNSLGFDLLIGGPGDDSYSVPSGTSALIVEQGSNDPLDELIAPSVNTSRSKFATLEQGRHLGIFDQTSDTSLFIYDWQKQANRIEVFYMQDKAYTFDQFKQVVIPAGQALPDLTWAQWDQQFGIGHISHIGIAEGVTLTKLAETYSKF
jgi:predicted transcriptional regulator